MHDGHKNEVDFHAANLKSGNHAQIYGIGTLSGDSPTGK